MADIPVSDLTEVEVTGAGVFDVLMRATKAHLEEEFNKGRIRGPEYSVVYLGSLEAVMKSALEFLLQGKKLALEAQLIEQQIINAEKEGRVLEATICKLQAEYDLILEQVNKVKAETDLLRQKELTERAQTVGQGVDADSVLGKQKTLYQAQIDGFSRDAEQKAAKLMVDTWNVRRTTDEGTVADTTNMLSDATIGRAVTKLLAGVNA